MKTSLWRKSVTTIVAAGIFFAAVSTAQARPYVDDRDPFTNGASPAPAPTRARVSAPARAAMPSVKPAPAITKVSKPAAAPVVIYEVPAPAVSITGIVKSAGTRHAIVSSGSATYIVSPGEKLGDYRVAAISDGAVTFTHTGKSFKIPMVK